jgi:cell division septation protein DedD
LKTRLLGAFVLIALLVIFVPMFFSSNPPPATASDQSVSLAIPPAQDSNLQTRTMSLSPGAPANAGTTAVPTPATPGTAGAVTTAPGQGSQLATVDIASRRPTDVGTDAAAPKAQPAGPVMGSGASPSQPVIPLQGSAATPLATRTPAKVSPVPAAAPPPAPVATPRAAGASADHALYVLNLSAYANAGSVDRLVRRVRGLGYPVLTRVITQAGKQLTLVTAGPFDSRTTAEAARLKITQSIPGVPAKLVEGLGHADSNVATAPAKATATAAAAPAAAAPRAGGYAVQLAALGSEAEANALRDKLRAGGFDGFVDTVSVGGKKLWRVRAGPQTRRVDAERVRDQIKAKFGIGGNVVGVP